MDCSLPGSSVHGIFQARTLEWVAISFSMMKVKGESEKVGLKLNIQKTKIMESGPIISWHIDGEKWKQWETLFSWAPKSLPVVTAAMNFKNLAPLKESYDKPRQCIKKQRHHFANKIP